MTIRYQDYQVNQVLTSAEMQDTEDNGVVQVDTVAELATLHTNHPDVNVAYCLADKSLYQRETSKFQKMDRAIYGAGGTYKSGASLRWATTPSAGASVGGATQWFFENTYSSGCVKTEAGHFQVTEHGMYFISAGFRNVQAVSQAALWLAQGVGSLSYSGLLSIAGPQPAGAWLQGSTIVPLGAGELVSPHIAVPTNTDCYHLRASLMRIGEL